MQSLEFIGEGQFGTVTSEVDDKGKKEVAVKWMDADSDQTRNEFAVARRLSKKGDHEHIIKILEFGESDDELAFLKMKKYDTDLFTFAFVQNKLSYKQVRKMFLQICKGIRSLHNQGIAHLDLKPENILVKDNKVVICDFGSSFVSEKVPKPSRKERRRKSETITELGTRGTRKYSSPEMHTSPGEYDPFLSDIYSLGVLLHGLLEGYYPPDFSERDQLSLDYLNNTELPETCISLLTNMLSTNPEARFTIDEIISHPWVQQKRIKLGSFSLSPISRSKSKAKRTKFIPFAILD